MKAKYRGNKIPSDVWAKAQAQWLPLIAVRAVFIIAGLFLVPALIPFAKKMETNVFGEGDCQYNTDRHPKASDKGWEFVSLPPEWGRDSVKRFLWCFGNDEDGFLGDRYGKWSDICNGNERSFINKYKWAALRNPVNNLSRYTEMFSVDVNECSIEYWGSYDENTGPYMVKATHKSGDVYYGYGNEPKGVMLGFKVYPRHGDNPEDIDGKDRGFTYRPF